MDYHQNAIATKPVQRWCIVFGKWIGFVGMLTLYVILSSVRVLSCAGRPSTVRANAKLAMFTLVFCKSASPREALSRCRDYHQLADGSERRTTCGRKERE